ncbi:hypothetical protein GQ457_14G018050 [Hibiscus cannabinus]
MFSRTHELTNKLISKAPRSNRQATKRTPSLSVNQRKRTKHKPEKNHNLISFETIFHPNKQESKKTRELLPGRRKSHNPVEGEVGPTH